MARRAALLPDRVQHSGNIRFGRRLATLLAVLVLTSATPAYNQEAVAVRAGIHPGFGRLVLEWLAPVEVAGHQEENRYALRFGRPLELVLDDALARLSDYLEGARLSSDARQLMLDLAPGVAVRQAVHERRIVILDLAPAAPAAAVEVRSGLHEGFGRIVFDWPLPTTFEAVTAAGQVIIRFSRAGRVDVAKPAARLGAWLAHASASRRDGRSEVRLEMQPGVSARVFKVDDKRVAVDLRTAPARPAGDVGAGEARSPAPAPARPAIAPTLVPPSDPPAPPPARIDTAEETIAPGQSGDGALLEFAWPDPVAAAAFVRAGHLWVVFADETNRPEDLVVPPALRDYLGRGARIEASGGTAIRFALRRPLSVETRREDRTWRVRLSTDAQVARPLYPLRLAAPARLRLDPGEPPRLVTVHDPETGDRLTVWPLLHANLGQPRQSFVELELLATAQGLAWRLRSDRVRAAIVEDAVEFDAPGGLALSEPPRSDPIAPALLPPVRPTDEPVTSMVAGASIDSAPAAPAPTPAVHAGPAPEPPAIARPDGAPADTATPLLGLVGWGLDPASTAPQRRSALLQTLAEAAPHERDAHRLQLARDYLSRGLAAEALGVLSTIQQPDDEASRRARQAITGAAELLMGRLDVAAGALGAAAFDDDPEVALWRAALAASREDWPRAARELERSEQVLATYPHALRARLGLAAARTAIETGDPGLAATLLAQTESLDLAPGERARLAFLSGLASARSGAIEAADQIWRLLEHDGPVEVRIDAAFARTELLLEAGELQPADAIARLAATRGLWSGHPREHEMLRALAQIHADAGDAAGALRTWRELLDRFPTLADAPAITARMRDALIESLLAEGEAAPGPVRAYALFREFEPLIPSDQLGDDLRRRMAERLAELDLIRPAAALLDALLTDRLAGVDKAAAGAALAELWLREPAPEAALAALERSRVDTALPPPLDRRRRILQADALARLEDRPAALALLDGLNTPSADDLRVAILRQERDWPRLISAIERTLARREPRSLTEREQAMALELALAHGRLGHTAALAKLRTRFAAPLRGGALEAAFLLATSAPATAQDPETVLAVAEQHLRHVRGYLAADRASN